MERQNYTNYHVVLVDDVSTDESHEQYYQLIKASYPRLRSRVTLIHNEKPAYSLANKVLMVYEYCNPGDIVADLDSDDELIGRQVLKVINAVYQQNPGTWIVNSNYIMFGGTAPRTGVSR